MRRAYLIRSIQRVLGEHVAVLDAAYLWTRHRLMVPFAATVFGAVVLLSPIASINDWPTRVVIGAAAVAVAVTASTEYSVLAQTRDGLHLLTASKIRQVATGLREHLGTRVHLEAIGGTGLTTDWQVGERQFTAPRNSEQAMARMAAATYS